MADHLEVSVDKFIFRVATDRRYSRDGVWVIEEAGRVRVGISDYQQQVNGDVAFVHLQPAGTDLGQHDEFAEIETIKAVVSYGAPVAGRMVAINSELDLTPESVNQDPYGTGWMAEMDPVDWPGQGPALLTPEAYASVVRQQAEEELQK